MGKCHSGSVVIGDKTGKTGAVAPYSVAHKKESFLGDDMWGAVVERMVTWSIGGDCCGNMVCRQGDRQVVSGSMSVWNSDITLSRSFALPMCCVIPSEMACAPSVVCWSLSDFGCSLLGCFEDRVQH